MKRLTVITASEVRRQIREQVLYIARDSVENALAWEDRLTTAIKGLGDFFGDAIDHDASSRLGYPVRKLVFEGTYLIRYWIDERASVIRVINFRHGARMPGDHEA